MMTREEFFIWKAGYDFLCHALDYMYEDAEAMTSGATDCVESLAHDMWHGVIRKCSLQKVLFE